MVAAMAAVVGVVVKRLKGFPNSYFPCISYHQSGRAGLHVCAERGHLEVAQELLEHKAYVNAKSKVRLHTMAELTVDVLLLAPVYIAGSCTGTFFIT